MDDFSSAMINEPNPLLPKKTVAFEKPPKCSIKSIKFKQLRTFKCFGEDDVDELGENFNLTR